MGGPTVEIPAASKGGARYAGGIARALSPTILDQLRVQERFDCWNRDEFGPMEEMYAEDAVF